MLPNPYTLLAGVILWGVSLAGVGWRAYVAGQEHELATQAREDRAVAVASDAAASAAAHAISKIKVQHRTVQQEIQREVVEKPVFRDCRSGPDAVRLLNSTIPSYKPEPAGSGVPATDALAR